MPKICQNVQKGDCQGAEGKSFFSMRLRIGLNVNFGFYIGPRNDSKIRLIWQLKIRFERCSGILQLLEATTNLKRSMK